VPSVNKINYHSLAGPPCLRWQLDIRREQEIDYRVDLACGRFAMEVTQPSRPAELVPACPIRETGLKG